MLRILYPLFLLPVAFSSVFASPEAALDQDDSSPGHTKPIIPRAYDQAGSSVTTKPTPKPSRGAIVFNIGTFTVTARPTGFKVGSAAVTPGGHITIGSETLLLKTGGGAIVLDESTVSFEKRPQTLSSTATPSVIGDSTSSVPKPSNTQTSSPSEPGGGGGATPSTRPPQNEPTTPRTTRSTPNPSHPGGGNPSHTSSTHSDPPTTRDSSTGTRTTPSPSHGDNESPSSQPPSQPPSTRSEPPASSNTKSSTTRKGTPTTHSTPKPSQSGNDGNSSHTVSSRDPTPSDSSTNGDTVTRTPTSPGPSHPGTGQTTAPPTTSPKTSADDWTTLSDSSTTGLYGFIILSDYKSLKTPTIITTQYIESSKTTTGPIFVGTGGIVLQSWPPSKNDDHDGGGGGALIIPNPIRPSISEPKLKCPAILKWLCGPDYTSSTDGGADVNPAAKPNSDPADDPNKDDEPTSEPTSDSSATSTSDTSTKDTTTTDAKTTTTSKSTSKSSSSGSTCTQTQTVTNCAAKCTPTVVSSKTTTICHTTSCSTVEACSTTGTISTTFISTSSQRCGSGSASACPTFSTPREWVYPEETVDTAEVDKLASSILSEDASIWKAFSSILAETGPGTTLATSTSRTSSGPATRTTATTHSAPSTTKSTKTKTSSGTSTTTSALSCVHQYSSTNDQDTCYCEGHSGNREVMSSSSGMTDYQPCAWTTLPPLYKDDNVGPITSTLANGDVVSCSSAHWAASDKTRKYCLGSMSTISTASHSTTTTTTSTTTSEGVSPTGEGDPTGEVYIGIVADGYTFSWNVYMPEVGKIPKWCDDSIGSMSASGDTTRYWLPPDIKFQDLKGGKASEVPCVYTGDKDNVGKLACLGMGEVPCTGDFKQSKDSPLCTNSPIYAGSAFPRVYCKWYGSDHSS